METEAASKQKAPFFIHILHYPKRWDWSPRAYIVFRIFIKERDETFRHSIHHFRTHQPV